MEITSTIRPKKCKQNEKWSWRSANKEQIKNDLMSWNWPEALLMAEASKAIDILNESIEKTYRHRNDNIPKYTYSTRPRPPWMSHELQITIRKRRDYGKLTESTILKRN